MPRKYCSLPAASLLLVYLILAGCAPSRSSPVSTTPGAPSAVQVALTPYRSSTPSPTSARPTATLTPFPTPTPTPFTYKVVKGDDMFGIALRFGVSITALKTANPTVNPYFLSVGTNLVIPVVTPTPAGTPTAQATPTQIPVTAGIPHCYPTADGGLWCLVIVKNISQTGVENLTVGFTLIDPASQTQTSQTAAAMLNLLPAGKSISVAAYFPAPIPAGADTAVQVLSALPVQSGDNRYLQATISDLKTDISTDGLSADISGQVSLPATSPVADPVWVSAAAYDQKGDPVGVRRWAAPSTLSAGSSLKFDFAIYSLGPAIDHVDVLVEARPASVSTPAPIK